MIKNDFFLFLLTILFFPLVSFSQTKNCLPEGKNSISVYFKAVYNKADNGLPDSIHVKGKIISCCNGSCGWLCYGGTMEVELTEKIKDYPHKTIILVTACLAYSECGKIIDVISSKLLETDTQCYYQSVMNCYQGHDIPFYKLSEKETSKVE
jgi:hypothetical protein